MSALTDMKLETRENFKWAINQNRERAIKLTYKVSGLADGRTQTLSKDFEPGAEASLGIIDAGRGQRLGYSKVGARYL